MLQRVRDWELDTAHDPLGSPPEDLSELIYRLRWQMAQEQPGATSSEAPPLLRLAAEEWLEEPPSTIGYTLNRAFLRMTGHPIDDMGAAYPCRRAILDAVPTMCRKRHQLSSFHHWADGSQRLLCAELARTTVLHQRSIGETARLAGVPIEKAVSFLELGLREAWYAIRESMMSTAD